VENRRLFLAALLSLGVLLLWQLVFQPPPPVRTPPSEVESQAPAASSTPGPEAVEEVTETAAVPSPGAPLESTGPLVTEPTAAEAERVVRIETATIVAEITNRGGQLLSFRLKEHRKSNDEPLELVRHRPGPPYPFAFVDGGAKPLPINDALFVAEVQALEGGGQELRLTYGGAEGQARKRFTFDDGDLFNVDVEAQGLPSGWGLLLGPELRNPSEKVLGSRYLQRSFSYLPAQDDLQALRPDKVNGERDVAGGDIRWLGLEDNYFLTALILEEPIAGVRVLPVLLLPDDAGSKPLPEEMDAADKDLRRGLMAVVQPGAAGLHARAFWGAKEYERLAAMKWGLEKSVRWGMFGVLSRPLLFGLRWIHDHVVHNYGWAIVLMTVLIKVVLFPLTHKSYVSMQKLQKLNPRMEAIRAKYRPKLKDKQGRPNLEMQRKMNEELQGLFREEGVNPAGGCLPILLQIPVFLAFFNLLRSAVELWNAPWIFWIRDLSIPDPYYVIPLVMGGTQLLQQRLTPAPPNPSQAVIMKSMPIVFTIFSLGFPSGLVLYWLTNNVLTIVQQGGYNRLKKAGFFGGEEPGDGKKQARAKAKGAS